MTEPDEGHLRSAEPGRIRWLTDVGLVAALYVFGAAGEVFLQNPTALEFGHITAASFGAGLRLGGGAAGTLSNGSVTLEYGRQARSDGVPDGDRFTLVSALRF